MILEKFMTSQFKIVEDKMKKGNIPSTLIKEVYTKQSLIRGKLEKGFIYGLNDMTALKRE